MQNSVLFPFYVADFSCIGGACEYNCCSRGWQLPIDKKSFQKYRQLPNAAFQKTFSSRVSRNRGADATDDTYARFVLKDGACPYFTQDGLCEIQQTLGAELLCNTCVSYPRLNYMTQPGLQETTISTTCPEAARKVLFSSSEPTYFIQQDDPALLPPGITPLRSAALLGSSKVASGAAGEFAWQLRSLCIDLMQARHHSLSQRLLLIGLLLNQLDELGGIQSPEKFYESLTLFEVIAEGGQGINPKVVPASDEAVQRELKKRLTNYLLQNSQLPAVWDLISAAVTEMGLKDKAQFNTDQILPVLLKLEAKRTESLFTPLLEQRGYVLENYFVNYLFQSFFPYLYTPSGMNMYHHFILLAEQYALFRMLLGGVPAGEELSDAHIVRIITSLSSLYRHHGSTPQRIQDFYGRDGMDSLPHMSLLL